MARMIKDVVALLNRLIQLDHDAIEACKAAMERLATTEDRAQIGSILGEHRRHADELAFVVRNLGGEPASHGDLRQVLTKGKVLLGGLSGDHAVLDAVRDNEEGAVEAYADAVSQPGIPVDVMALLERHLADERRHHAGLAARTDPSPAGANEYEAPSNR
jgi:uncharacterized protein (TIGR02284 family)